MTRRDTTRRECPMPRDIYDDMARTNHPIGRRLRDSQVRSCTSVVLGGVSFTRNFYIVTNQKFN